MTLRVLDQCEATGKPITSVFLQGLTTSNSEGLRERAFNIEPPPRCGGMEPRRFTPPFVIYGSNAPKTCSATLISPGSNPLRDHFVIVATRVGMGLLRLALPPKVDPQSEGPQEKQGACPTLGHGRACHPEIYREHAGAMLSAQAGATMSRRRNAFIGDGK